MKKGLLRVKPWCPFCGQNIGRPTEPGERKMDEFLAGECQCGAVYVSEPTGYNIGAAIVECMVAACHDNYDLAFDLEADVDYLSSRVEDYDEVTHYIYETREHDGRRISGILYFVRLTKDFADLTSQIKVHETKKSAKIKSTALDSFAIPEMEEVLDPKRKKIRVKKAEVDTWVKDADIDKLVAAALDNPKTLRFIQRLLYSPSEDERYYTAHIMAQVCRRVSTLKPGMVSDLLHRMFESCTDSAATHWGILETIGAIIAARSDQYGSFARHLLMYRGVDSSRAIILWALGTIAKESPEVVRKTAVYALFNFVEHEEAITRGNAVRLFGRINAMEVRGAVEELLGDTAELTVYEDGLPHKTTVGKLAKEALANMGIMSEGAKPAPMSLGNAVE